MGFFTWGPRDPEFVEEKTVALSKLRNSRKQSGHKGRSENRSLLKASGPPIDIKPDGTIIDGHDRTWYAKARGDKTIKARVWR